MWFDRQLSHFTVIVEMTVGKDMDVTVKSKGAGGQGKVAAKVTAPSGKPVASKVEILMKIFFKKNKTKSKFRSNLDLDVCCFRSSQVSVQTPVSWSSFLERWGHTRLSWPMTECQSLAHPSLPQLTQPLIPPRLATSNDWQYRRTEK